LRLFKEKAEVAKSHIGSGVRIHPLKIYVASSAAYMPVA